MLMHCLLCWAGQHHRDEHFKSYDLKPCSQALVSLLVPRGLGELMLKYCLLCWAGQKALFYLL